MENDSLWQQKDPKLLLVYAIKFYKEHYDPPQTVIPTNGDMLWEMLHLNVGVRNRDGVTDWYVERQRSNQGCLSLINYFQGHYASFSWDSISGCFKSREVVAPSVQQLFDQLKDADSSIAFSALLTLTTIKTSVVNEDLPAYTRSLIKELPAFVALSAYMRADIAGSEKLRKALPRIAQTADSLAEHMTMDDVTAFEYWMMLHQQYSIGSKVLERVYARHWSMAVGTRDQLWFYLKKAALLSRFTEENYLQHFKNSQPKIVVWLQEMRRYSEPDVLAIIDRAIAICKAP